MTQIQSISKAEQLKNQILDEIRRGIYKPGDRIPSVMAFSARYGVSKNTVAQALSNLNELQVLSVSHGKSTRVRENPLAHTIEVLFFGYGNLENQDFWGDFHRGIAEEAAKHPEYLLHISGFDSKFTTPLSSALQQRQFSGALILGTSKNTPLALLRNAGVPVVSIHDYTPGADCAVVTTDLSAAMGETIELLRKRRRVAFFYAGEAIEAEKVSGINRVKRFEMCRRLLDSGLMPDKSFIRETEFSDDAGYRLLMQMKSEGSLPDGIVLFSDVIAPGVCRAAYELKLDLPKHISIVGMDNLSCGRFTIPSLTSIDVRRKEQGALALARLIEAVETGRPPRGDTLPARLIRRESL